MLRSFIFIALISLLPLTDVKSEDFPFFSIGFCLDSSTHIVKGKILDEDGSIKIETVFKGQFPSSHLMIPELRDINQNGDYSPNTKTGWEVIIFFKTNVQHELIPVFYWESDHSSKALGFALSTVWIKDGGVFYAGFSPDDRPKFLRQEEQSNLEHMIIEHVRTEEAIHRIEKYKSCEKKLNRLEKLYEESDFPEMIFNAMLRTKCGDEIVSFVRPIVLDSQYSYMQLKMFPSFVEYGQQQIVPDLEIMFDKEFNFWKTYIGIPERRLWWHFDSRLQMRFTIFGTLMHQMIKYKLGDWELHAHKVIDYFSNLKAYQADDGYGHLNDSVQRWLMD